MTVDIQTSVAEGHTTNNAFTLTIDDNQMAWLAVDVPNEKNEYLTSGVCRSNARYISAA